MGQSFCHFPSQIPVWPQAFLLGKSCPVCTVITQCEIFSIHKSSYFSLQLSLELSFSVNLSSLSNKYSECMV